MLPLSPPYGSATVIFCGATWGYNNIYGAPHSHAMSISKSGQTVGLLSSCCAPS